MASLKRKREETSDSEDDEPSYGRQILPVANLPDHFDRAPANGMEYLFMVRREMRSLPVVTRVVNPYETASSPQPPKSGNSLPSHPALPSPEWRAIYKKRFRNFRKNFNQPTIHVQYVSYDASQKIMPDKKERDLWWAFLSGKPETEWNSLKKPRNQKENQKKAKITHDSADDETVLVYEALQLDSIKQEAPLMDIASHRLPLPPRSTAREPLPSLLKCIDEPIALHLLMYFVHWFNLYLDGSHCETYYPTECHARWIFSLLARVEDCISGDDIALLRGLARACITILGQLLGRYPPAEVSADQGGFISRRSCWIIISTVVDIWAQHDLWVDAEDMLKVVAG